MKTTTTKDVMETARSVNFSGFGAWRELHEAGKILEAYSSGTVAGVEKITQTLDNNDNVSIVFSPHTAQVLLQNNETGVMFKLTKRGFIQADIWGTELE